MTERTESHPIPIPSFDGRIGRTLADSEASFEAAPHPGEESPNAVVVLLDDTASPTSGHISDHAATMAEVLGAQGYAEVDISLGGRSQQDTETAARTEMSRQ